MEETTIYKAVDSTMFDSKYDCEYYESVISENKNKLSKKWILEYLYDGLIKSDEQFKCQFKAAIDWLNEKHFDRGLIEKGLAIDATNLNIY